MTILDPTATVLNDTIDAIRSYLTNQFGFPFNNPTQTLQVGDHTNQPDIGYCRLIKFNDPASGEMVMISFVVGIEIARKTNLEQEINNIAWQLRLVMNDRIPVSGQHLQAMSTSEYQVFIKQNPNLGHVFCTYVIPIAIAEC